MEIDAEYVWLVAEDEVDGVYRGQEVAPGNGALQGGRARALMHHQGDMVLVQKY